MLALAGGLVSAISGIPCFSAAIPATAQNSPQAPKSPTSTRKSTTS